MEKDLSIDDCAEDLLKRFIELRERVYGRSASYDEIMSYLGCKTELDTPIIDAFLIKAVKKRFGTSNIEADIVLMDLGLLKGYDYNVELTITDRRAKFLQESHYLIHDKDSYSDASKSKKKTYLKRLEANEDRLLLRLAAFLNKLRDIEVFLGDIDKYMDDGVPNLPAPSYMKRQGFVGKAMTAVIKYLVLGKEFFTSRQKTVINKNNECEIEVDLTERIIRMASASLGVLVLLSAVYHSQSYQLHEERQKNRYASVEEASKRDYDEIPLAQQEDLSSIDD